MEALIYAVAFGGNALIMNLLGEYLTEVRRPFFAFKPFNCWPCASFWLTIIGALIIASFNGGALYYGVALITGFINFYYIHSLFKISL